MIGTKSDVSNQEKKLVMDKKIPSKQINSEPWNKLSPSDQASFYLDLLLADIEQDMGNTVKAIHYRLQAIRIHFSSTLMRKTIHQIDSLSTVEKRILEKRYGALFLFLCRHTELNKLPLKYSVDSKTNSNRTKSSVSDSDRKFSHSGYPSNLISIQEVLASYQATSASHSLNVKNQRLKPNPGLAQTNEDHTKIQLEIALNEMGDDKASIAMFQTNSEKQQKHPNINNLMDSLLSDI